MECKHNDQIKLKTIKMVKDRSTLGGSTFGVRTNVKVSVYNLGGSLKEVKTFHNIISNVGKNLFRDALKGSVTDLLIKKMAWGYGSMADNAGRGTLVREFGRKQITDRESGSTGVQVTTTYIAPYEATGSKIEELGWYAGAYAGTTRNSGVMISRVLYSRQKSGSESLQIERTDTISEVV